MTDREAMKMALHALEFSLPAIEDFGSKEQLTDCHRAIMALYKSLAQPEQEPVKKALRLKPHECICGYSVGHPLVPKCICKPEYTAQPEQEPVAWMMPDYGDVLSASEADGTGIYNIPLYSAPPKREWVSLNNMDITGAAHDEAIHPVFILETTKSGLCM